MKLKSILSVLGLFIGITTLLAQSQTRRDYIQQYQDIAVSEMERTGIPASIKMAQAILESGDGRSLLARKANNHFGIKCGGKWNGKTYYIKDDDHDRNGKLIESCFRAFKSPEASFIAHSDFLQDPRKARRYGFLFDYSNTDYKKWAKGLRKAGYATNPKYPQLLINIIEENQLYQLDTKSAYPILVSRKPKDKFVDISIIAEYEPHETTRQREQKYHKVYYHNDIKMAFAKIGDTPASIAKRFGISLKRLLKYNEIKIEADFEENERIYLQPKRSKFRGKQKYHTVKSGETMFDIAQLYGIKIKKLYKKNKMSLGQEPAEGAKIALRKKTKRMPKLRSASNISKPKTKPVRPKTETPPPVVNHKPNVKKSRKETKSETSKVVHTVKKGETLYRIAKQHGVSVEQIKQFNRLGSNTIDIGQELIVRYK